MSKASLTLLLFYAYSMPFIYSQENRLTPFSLKVEHFSDTKRFENGLTFDENGLKLKVVNTNYEKGLKIIDKEKGELWHGIVYRFSSGKLDNMTTYEFGKRHGLYEGYSLKSGKALFRREYENDLKEGKAYQFAGDGEYIYSETNYTNGEINGEEIFYYNPENGESRGPISTKNIYEGGKKIESTTFYRDGRVYSNKKY